MYFIVVGYGALHITIRSVLLIVIFESSTYLLYLFVWSVRERKEAKVIPPISQLIVVDLPISLSGSGNFCFLYFEPMLLKTWKFGGILSSW